jgi:hypothetical protein
LPVPVVNGCVAGDVIYLDRLFTTISTVAAVYVDELVVHEIVITSIVLPVGTINFVSTLDDEEVCVRPTAPTLAYRKPANVPPLENGIVYPVTSDEILVQDGAIPVPPEVSTV